MSFGVSHLRSVCMALACIAWTGIARAEIMYIGELHDATSGELVLTVSTELVAFELASTADVTLDGHAVTVEELAPGDRVSLIARRGEGRTPIAVEVVAYRHLIH